MAAARREGFAEARQERRTLERRLDDLTDAVREGFDEARRERREMNRSLHQRMDNLQDAMQTSFDEVRKDLALIRKAHEHARPYY